MYAFRAEEDVAAEEEEGEEVDFVAAVLLLLEEEERKSSCTPRSTRWRSGTWLSWGKRGGWMRKI